MQLVPAQKLTLSGITSAMIGHIKSIKMSGLSQKLSSTIAALRVQEIKASRPFRVFGAVTSAIAQIPLLMSPPVAFAMYQGVVTSSNGQHFDATRLFSALSFIILLAQPLFWMFEVVLDLSAAFGAFERIQKFLIEETRNDYRRLATVPVSPGACSHQGSDIELQSLRASAAGQAHAVREPGKMLEVQDASFAWTPEKNIVEHVQLGLTRGQFAMIVGPVASGKTTLLKGLLGEVPHVSGTIWLGTDRLSWCDQSPWILVSCLLARDVAP
jgi:ABC-type multidrug transport system fused ATPase/permease subunit